MLTEMDQSIREMQTEAAKPGKNQSLAKLRLERRESVAAILRWCRDNSEGLRAYRAAHKQEGEGK
jgi:hypothetical protein